VGRDDLHRGEVGGLTTARFRRMAGRPDLGPDEQDEPSDPHGSSDDEEETTRRPIFFVPQRADDQPEEQQRNTDGDPHPASLSPDFVTRVVCVTAPGFVR
jgi:hypothetical protein